MSNKMPADNHEKTVSARKLRFIVTAAIPIVLLLLAVLAYGLFGMGARTDAPAPAVTCEIDPQLATARITTKDVTLEAELAETQTQKYKGLSGRTCLDTGRAMLFAYGTADSYCFVMRDMNFPIDMIWLDGDKRVVTIKHEAQPESYPEESYCPDRPAQYVLEVAAGLAKKHDWAVGTQFSF